MLDLHPLTAAIVIGTGATLVMDLWVWLLNTLFKVPSMSFCLVGRWISHMKLGVFRHQSIGKATPQKAECLIGWLSHYLIGIAFALLLILPNDGQWLHNPSLEMALLVGLGTVVFPFFLMQPALGSGIAASKTPSPAKARLKSLMTHGIFGLGLYVSGLLFVML
jgi:hypothetical protein